MGGVCIGASKVVVWGWFFYFDGDKKSQRNNIYSKHKNYPRNNNGIICGRTRERTIIGRAPGGLLESFALHNANRFIHKYIVRRFFAYLGWCRACWLGAHKEWSMRNVFCALEFAQSNGCIQVFNKILARKCRVCSFFNYICHRLSEAIK